MESKKIYLNTKEQLRIYMSPQRQNLIRILRIAACPMTAKEIAERMGISASSAQLHIQKLAGLEILEKDHTERINGITATYYRLADADIFIGLGKEDGLQEERDAVVQNMMMQTYENAKKVMRSAAGTLTPEEQRRRCCDSRSGVFYLKPGDIDRLENFIDAFLEEKRFPAEGTLPWEWSYVLYNTRYENETDGENGNA
jgi:Predicted transcriptional regulator